MKPQWVNYWRNVRRYLRHVLFGVPIGLIPFVASLDGHFERGTTLNALTVALMFGVLVPVSIMAWYMATYAAIVSARRGRPFKATISLHALCLAGGMATGIWLATALQSRVFGTRPTIAGVFLPSLAFGCLVVALFLYYHAHRQAKEEALEYRLMASEASYRALESQMQPHFLFNALNSLAELIETGNGGASDVAHSLSNLYRQVLANSKSKTSSLDSEVEIARRYLEIERVRFGHRLTYSIDVPDELLHIHLPSLVIEALVENAVKHGIAKSVDGGHVAIHVEPTGDGKYRLAVVNSGAPYDGGAAGTGIANTTARLDLLYGTSHGFSITRDAEGRTVASFAFGGEPVE